MFISRRNFISSAIGSTVGAAAIPDVLAAVPAAPAQAARTTRRLRVQFTPGGHTAPLQIYAMFEDPVFKDVEPMVLPHPNAFNSVSNTIPPDVIVTNDWLTTQWSQDEKENIAKHLEAGRGVVVLHHAVGTNDQWTWWADEVIGCHLYNTVEAGMKTSARLKQFVIQTLNPVGNHPIVRGMDPFELPWDETFPNMWVSPKATVLYTTDDPSANNPAQGWVGPPLPRGRVVCFQPGHTRFAAQDPNYRRVVHNMILWTGGRLS
jgi:type 1 glutamine amidotransferase